MNEIMDYVSNNIFSIVMCILIFWQSAKEREKYLDIILGLKDDVKGKVDILYSTVVNDKR